MKTYEAEEQIALFEWASVMENQFPELRLLHHIPNGGSRNPAEAVNLKRQGVKAGVPDIFLPVARGVYHGLYIEMKVGTNKTTDTQNRWLGALRKQGYAAFVCRSWESAQQLITQYMKGTLR